MKTSRFLLLFLFLGLFSFPIPSLGQEQEPIIDMHLHADLPPQEIKPGEPAPCRPAPCEGKGHATASHDETLEKTLEMMDRHNIVKAHLSGLDPAILAKWKEAAPDRFIISPFVFQPGQPAAEDLRPKIEEGFYLGMGEIATELAGIPPNDPKLEPYFALAEEYNLPTLIHTAGIGPYLPSFRTNAGNPLLLEDVLVRHPKLRLYVENSGYPFRDEMIAMMSQYPQLYGDVSTITWVIPKSAFYDYLKALVTAGLGKRIMYGTDQMRWPEMIEKGINAIKEADFLTEEQKRDILYNNAARFLEIEQEKM